MGSIFDHGDTMFGGQRQQRIHIRGQPPKVDGDDRLGPFGDRRFDQVDIQVIGFGINIDKDRGCAGQAGGVGGGNKGVGRHNHLVTRADTDHTQGCFQGQRAIDRGKTIPGPMQTSKGTLKFAHGRVKAPPLARFEDILQMLPFTISPLWPARPRGTTHGGIAIDR